jgi:hypothetical protein
MKCKGCLIWQRRDRHLRESAFDFIPKLARFLHKSEIGELQDLISEQSKHLNDLWRQNIQLMDSECPPGRCILPV